jgi:diaminopropionate ammonia-lyase
MRAGRIVELPGPHDSIMAGLNCGVASVVAWPAVSAGIDLFVAIEDERAREGMRALAAAGVVAGETGAAGVGGLIDLLTGEDAPSVRAALGVSGATRVLVLSTEGATDPDAYARIVGRAVG